MFAGFNLKIDETAILDDTSYNTGLQLLKKNNIAIRKNLMEYVCENKYVDGSSLQNDWFSQKDADIFISHSNGLWCLSVRMC